MDELDRWAKALARELGVTDVDADIQSVLDMARDAAHGVMRPAAPVTTFLVGVAVARGTSQKDAAAIVTRAASDWVAGSEQSKGLEGTAE